MARLGADVEDLDALARVLSSAGGRIGRVAGSLTTAIGGVVWLGPDAEHFRATWRSRHAPRLQEVAGIVEDLAAALREQASEQRRTSAPDGAATPVGVDGRPPPAGPDADHDGWPDWLEDSWLGSFLPVGPKYLHSGPDSPWTPQGQGYDAERDEILTTYYDQDDTRDGAPDLPGVLLSIQDRTTGSEATHVHLVGVDGTGGPLHGGGVSTDGEHVYVVGDGTVWVYDRDAIDAAPPGGEVTPRHVYEDVRASSFSTIHDGRLYVGEYVNRDPGSLYSYELGPGGTLLGADGTPRDEQPAPLLGLVGLDGGRYEGPTPHNSQGVAVHGGGFLFTQSHGEDDPSDLLHQPFGADEARTIGQLSPLSQGLNVIGDQLYVTSEAGAYQFDVPDAPVAIDVFDVTELGLDP